MKQYYALCIYISIYICVCVWVHWYSHSHPASVYHTLNVIITIWSSNSLANNSVCRLCDCKSSLSYLSLTRWGRMTHICVSKLTIIDSDNGWVPGRRQAIIWTNAGILLIGHLGTNGEIHIFSFKKMHFKLSSAKWKPFCLGLNVLINRGSHAKTWMSYMQLSSYDMHRVVLYVAFWLKQIKIYRDPS